MAKRERVLSRGPFEIGEPNEVLTVEVAYEDGGANWFHGGTSARGYFVRVRPEKIEAGSRSFTLGEGCKALIEPAKRFSEKRMAEVAPSSEIIAKLIAKVTADRVERNARMAHRLATFKAQKAAEQIGG